MQVVTVVSWWNGTCRRRSELSKVKWCTTGAGFGHAGMGGKNAEALDNLEQTLFMNPAVAGEARHTVGLILLRTANTTGCLLTHGNPT
jgi:hypothetical protein